MGDGLGFRRGFRQKGMGGLVELGERGRIFRIYG